MPLFLTQVRTIAAKDLRAELRTKEALNASLAFSVVILLLFSFAFDPTSDELRGFGGGLLWIVYAFAGALALNRSFARELQNDCLDALIASPAPAGALFLGKAIANYVLLIAVELLSMGVFAIFYNIRVFGPTLDVAGDPVGDGKFFPILLVLLLGTWAMTVIGTMFSALTVNLQMREVMLPVLVYPFLIPALMAAMTLTTDLLNGGAIAGDNLIWIRVLVAFDVIFSALAVVFIDVVLVG